MDARGSSKLASLPNLLGDDSTRTVASPHDDHRTAPVDVGRVEAGWYLAWTPIDFDARNLVHREHRLQHIQGVGRVHAQLEDVVLPW